MSSFLAEVEVKNRGRTYKTRAEKVLFSAFRCLDFEATAESQKLVEKIFDYLQSQESPRAYYGTETFLNWAEKSKKGFKELFAIVAKDDLPTARKQVDSLPSDPPAPFPTVEKEKIKTVFIGDTIAHRIHARSQEFRDQKVVTPSILAKIAFGDLPEEAWITDWDTIYPIDIPKVEIESNLDLLLLDSPARNLALMPNGLAYVHNAIKKTGVKFQTLDLDIIAYHHFHSHRVLDLGGKVVSRGGYEMKADPWLAENYDEWTQKEVLEYFNPLADQVIQKVITARPKILAMSLQSCNVEFTTKVVQGVKAALPDTVVLVGGYLCYHAEIGRKAFPLCDYMCIGEADLTLGPLVEALARGERPKNLAGIQSRYDSEDWLYKPAPMPVNLDELEMARYDWTDLSLYRNYDDYQLVPIIASRGCRWSKCTFCAERFFWRVRSPKAVVDEFEYLSDQGCDLFMFNESDLNGKPEIVLEICDEIIRRKLKLKLTGQLRVHKKSDRAFFDKLRAAGFCALRFGVDAWSKNTLRLQKKGYTVEMISKNLQACHNAGIVTEVNTVVGVPGETEEDIDESIDLMIQNKMYIGRTANINTLMLVPGSVYWEQPERLGIKFREDKETLLRKYPRRIPEDLWYSENPYIDGPVRKKRFSRIVKALDQAGFDVGGFAQATIDSVTKATEQPEVTAGSSNSAFGQAKGEEEKETPSEIRAASAEPAERSAIDMSLNKVMKVGDEFYAVPRDTKEWRPIKVHILKTLTRMTKNSYKTLKTRGWQGFTAKAHDKLRRIFLPMDDLSHRSVEKEGTISLKKNYSMATEIVNPAFHGYRILRIKRDCYGFVRDLDFNKTRADKNAYPSGVCFRASTIRGVENQILDHLKT